MFPDPMRAFLLVVQTGSVRKASERLGLSPSSVSRQIAILERQIGTALFQRSLNRLKVTHAGEMVADYAEATVSGFDALRSDIDDMRGSQRLITVAMVESVASSGPADAIMQFRRSHPGVRFDLHILPAPQVFDAVRNNNCDLGIAFCSTPSSEVRVVSRVAEPLVLLAPMGFADDGENVALDALTNEPVAIPEATFGVRRIFEQACAERGIQIRPVLETNSFEVLRDFVRSGAGVAIVPFRAAVREQQKAVARCHRIDHPAFTGSTLDLMVSAGQRLPRLNRLFLDVLVEVLNKGEDVAPYATQGGTL